MTRKTRGRARSKAATAEPATGRASSSRPRAKPKPVSLPNPLIGVHVQDVFDLAQVAVRQLMVNPGLIAGQYLSFVDELGKIMTGKSELTPDPKDRRFADPAWKDSPAYRILAQYYLAWSGALNRLVDEAKLEKRDAERARFVVSLFVDAMAPTNTLAGNPAAMRKLAETGGASLIRGLENFVKDLATNRGLPAQVDTSKFAVGKNVATTPGAVIYRNPVMELIQYQPVGKQVHQRPLLIAPPQINKFYVFDLAPDKSIVQLALKGDLQTFAISWKNPTSAERHFGLDTYVGALDEAVEVMREITGSDDVSMWGSCSGGITMAAYLAQLAARRKTKVRSATVGVCVLDMAVAQSTALGTFVTAETITAAKEASRLIGFVDGQEMARMFAWMRPNDLIWNYWVNNYLMGNAPPAFDVLYWNSDTTRLPAKLHADFLDLIFTNPFVNPGQLAVCGTPLDMRRLRVDSYVIAGVTDHITPWQGCYGTARLFGTRSTFVLANNGHIQSLLNPPGNPKAFFWSAEAREASAEAWQEKATKHAGSWWPHWLEWIKARSGAMRDRPSTLGSSVHQPVTVAPGQYVMET
jgi:poly[(R)-3-hydroxyalkanoate] polymerase subunit PhaC